MDSKRKKKVLLNYYALLHYRKSLFEYLSCLEDYDVQILCGRESQFESMKYYEHKYNNVIFIKNFMFKMFKVIFLIQFGIIRETIRVNPDIIIIRGVNPLILSSLYHFLFLKIFKRNIKIYWWGHGSIGHQGRFGIHFRKIFYRFSDGVLLQGNKAKQRLLGIGLPEEKLFVIGNSINNEDLGYLSTDIKENLITDSIGIIFTGRLTARKKLNVLIEALYLLKEKGIKFHCNIIGDGPEIEKIQQHISDRNLDDKIVLRGELYGEDLTNFFIDSNIMIMPEAVGLSIIHSFSFGVPIITSNNIESHGPEIEIMEEGVTGSYYEKDKPEMLLEEILTWNDKLSKENKIASKCIESVKEGYTTKHVGDRVNKIFEQSRK